MVQTDFSSGIEPVGNTWRSLGSSWFNQENIAREDFLREQQASDLDFQRSLAGAQYQNEFNASEAEKQRNFEERMSSTAYQRAVDDMKKAGINPLLAFSHGGASTPSGASASSGSVSSSRSHSSYKSSSDPLGSLLLGIAKIGAGLYSSSPHEVLSGVTEVLSGSGSVKTRTVSYDYKKRSK